MRAFYEQPGLAMHGFLTLLFVVSVASCTMPPAEHESAKEVATNNASLESHKLPGNNQFMTGQLLVKFNNEVSEKRALEVLAENRTAILGNYSEHQLYLVALPDGIDVKQGVRIFSALTEVEFAEPNHIYKSED